MDQDGPILDYASPRKRLKLRLPAKSSLFCKIERDEIVLTETLAARGGIGASLAFALVLQIFTIIMSLDGMSSRLARASYFIPLVLVAVQIPLMGVIVHQTWRKTILTVRYNQMLLDFTSPLWVKHYRWTGAVIADMLLMETANTQTEMPLAELLITRAVGGEIHLFTDHRADELQRLIAILPPMLREGQGP